MIKLFTQLILLSSIVFLQACIQDVFWPSETRVQVINESSTTVDSLRVLSPVNSIEPIMLMNENLKTGDRSRVKVYEFSGIHTLQIWGGCQEQAEDCLSSLLLTQKMTLDGGSVKLLFKDSSQGFILEID